MSALQPLSPLQQGVAIVDGKGGPSSFFMRAFNTVWTNLKALLDAANSAQATADAAVPQIRKISVGPGLIGGGDLSADRTISLDVPDEWAANFTAAGDLYIPAKVAMTIDQGNAKIGTGTITFAKSTTAAPSTFGATTLPATIQAGAWLKVTAASVTGFVATHLVRTA